MSSLKDNFEDKKDALSEDIQEAKEAIGKSIDQGVRRTKSFFFRVLIFAGIGLVVAGGLYLGWSNWTYSEGSRTGYLMKLSRKGYVFKTYEGQLNLGGFQETETGGLAGTIWNFSLRDDALVRQMEELEGQKVQLRYKEFNQALPWQGDTNYFVYAIEKR